MHKINNSKISQSSETFIPPPTEPAPGLKPHGAELQNVHADVPTQPALARAYGIDPLSGSGVAGEEEAEKFVSLRHREKQLISAPKRGRAVMFRVMS